MTPETDWHDPGGLGKHERSPAAGERDARDVTGGPNVSVIGASSCGPEVTQMGEDLGALLAERGCTVFCGGMSGVMEAVARGVRRGGGVCVGILPTLDRRHAAPDLTLSVCTGIGHGRNLAVVASGDVVIALGGAWGTLSEIGMARAIDRQVVVLRSWKVEPDEGDVDGLHVAHSATEAVDLALSLVAT
jgi:hypothetical protein